MEKTQNLSLSGSFEEWFKIVEDNQKKADIQLAQKAFSLDEYRAEYYINWTWDNQKKVALFPLLNKEKGKFCDIGCGSGALHRKFFDTKKDIEIIGVDIAPTGLIPKFCVK